MTVTVDGIQQALKEEGLDGWLFCDFHNRDPLAYRILGLPFHRPASRRWYYYIPAQGTPKKLVHSVEAGHLDSLPGEKVVYLPWQQLHESLRGILAGGGRVAMQYSPLNAIPYVSLVDGGTVDLVRSFGVDVVSSADLVGRFEALVEGRGLEMHLDAGRKIHGILDRLWARLRGEVAGPNPPNEWEVQGRILEEFKAQGLDCGDHMPIVAVDDHAADPHFCPTPHNARPIVPGNLLLVDLWARRPEEGGIYYDVTWTAHVGGGEPVSQEQLKVFGIVRDARNRAVSFLEERFAAGEPVHGYEVDRVVRNHIAQAGYAEAYLHRTGHSIGAEVHGNGVNIDDLETRDSRRIVPGCLFSIEPGIYLEGRFGVRSEIDVYVDMDGRVMVTGPRQEELVIV